MTNLMDERAERMVKEDQQREEMRKVCKEAVKEAIISMFSKIAVGKMWHGVSDEIAKKVIMEEANKLFGLSDPVMEELVKNLLKTNMDEKNYKFFEEILEEKV